MARCPSCEYPLPEDCERLGARCPHCRDPLYEHPGRSGQPVREGESACTAHPDSEAVGTCGRCGNFLCAVCRTRWHGQVMCVACLDRALEANEAAPQQTRAHRRQAILGLAFGGGAWLLTLLVVLLLRLVGEPGSDALGVLILLFLLVLGASAILATVGLGLAAAALRTRGDHMILATLGLLLCGIFLGAFIGLFSFSLLQV